MDDHLVHAWGDHHQEDDIGDQLEGHAEGRYRSNVHPALIAGNGEKQLRDFSVTLLLAVHCPNVRHTNANPFPGGAGGGTSRGIAGNSAETGGHFRAAGEAEGPSRQRGQPSIQRMAHRTGQATES